MASYIGTPRLPQNRDTGFPPYGIPWIWGLDQPPRRQGAPGELTDVVDAAVQQELQPQEQTRPSAPIMPDIPLLKERRLMRLDEVANASIVGQEKPTFLSRLGTALEGAAMAQPFDARSESFGPAFFGTALNTFAGARMATRDREQEQADLYNQIMSEAETQRLENLKTAAQLGLMGSQEARNYAQAQYYEQGGAQRAGERVPNLEPLAQAIEQDYPDIAAFIRADPITAGRAPGTILNLVGPDETAERTTQRREERAAQRYYTAEGRATSDISTMMRSTNPLVLAGVRTEEQQAGLREKLTRGYDPSFVQDSIIANRIMQGLGGGAELPRVDLPTPDEVPGYTPPAMDNIGGRPGAPPKPSGAPEPEQELVGISQAVKGLPIGKALEAISAPDISPPFTAAEKKSILLGAGFTATEVDSLVNERVNTPARPRR
jgi:hypothetical protein